MAGIAIGGFFMTRSQWYRIRMYAMDVKKIFDKHNIQEKAQAVQSLGANPNQNPMLIKKPLKDLTDAYRSMLEDLEKIKVPKKATEVHEATKAMHRESLSLYQMAAVGGFRQKSLLDKQKKLQNMEKGLQEKMEKLYGKMKRPEELTGFQGWLARTMQRFSPKK